MIMPRSLVGAAGAAAAPAAGATQKPAMMTATTAATSTMVSVSCTPAPARTPAQLIAVSATTTIAAQIVGDSGPRLTIWLA